MGLSMGLSLKIARYSPKSFNFPDGLTSFESACMQQDERTDEVLVKEAQAGDRHAFLVLVERYQARIWRQAMRIAQKSELADELAQQVFLKAFTKLKTFRGEAPFGAWLSRVALNLGRDLKRSQARATLVDIEDVTVAEDAVSEEQVGAERKKAALRTAIEALPQKQREVVVLRVYEDYSFKEIAASMGGSEGTAKVNFHYALKNLRGLMKETV